MKETERFLINNILGNQKHMTDAAWRRDVISLNRIIQDHNRLVDELQQEINKT